MSIPKFQGVHTKKLPRKLRGLVSSLSQYSELPPKLRGLVSSLSQYSELRNTFPLPKHVFDRIIDIQHRIIDIQHQPSCCISMTESTRTKGTPTPKNTLNIIPLYSSHVRQRELAKPPQNWRKKVLFREESVSLQQTVMFCPGKF